MVVLYEWILLSWVIILEQYDISYLPYFMIGHLEIQVMGYKIL